MLHFMKDSFWMSRMDAERHVTVFTFRMKSSSHEVPHSPLGQHGWSGVDMHVVSPHMAEAFKCVMSDKNHLHQIR